MVLGIKLKSYIDYSLALVDYNALKEECETLRASNISQS